MMVFHPEEQRSMLITNVGFFYCQYLSHPGVVDCDTIYEIKAVVTPT